MSDAELLIDSVLSDDLSQALQLLEAHPDLAYHDLATACVTGTADAVARHLQNDAGSATAPTGPHNREPLLYATFSRLGRIDPAVQHGIRTIVNGLLGAGADPNTFFTNADEWIQAPIYGAAGIAGDAELTGILLAAGADPNDISPKHGGGEALYHAVEHADPTCAQLLVEAGADPHTVSYSVGRALNFPRHPMVAMLCEHGARIHEGHLHQALWRRRPPRTVETLLDAGAPIDTRDNHGVTPLQIAMLWNDSEAVELLRRRGATPTAQPDGHDPQLLDTMLNIAIAQGDVGAVAELLDAGARLDGDPAADPIEAPMPQACWRGQAEVVELLLSRGVATQWGDGGSALGATRHGSRNCHHPEGGPTMATVQEIDQRPYQRIERLLEEKRP